MKNVIRLIAATFIAACFFFPPLMAQSFHGTVIDSATGTPIPGVRVSIGHSIDDTLTDTEGRFELSVSDLSMIPSKSFSAKGGSIRLRWLGERAVIDFSKAPQVTTYALFDLHGVCIVHTSVAPLYRTTPLPNSAQGVLLLRLIAGNGPVGALRLTIVPGCNAIKEYRVAGKNYAQLRHPPTASTIESVPLLFRHDGYFPYDLNGASPATDLEIRLTPDPRAEVFDPAHIHEFSFTLQQEDSLLMEHDALKEEYVKAQCSYDGVAYGQVGLRYKGSEWSLDDCFDSVGTRTEFDWCRKVSLKIKFNKYVDSTRFFTMKRLNLNSMSRDWPKMNEILGYRLFRSMGIYAPRTAYVKVTINGTYQGLFLAVEAVDGRFTKARWPLDGDGNLYKEAWPHYSSTDYYAEKLETNNGPEDSTDVSRMPAFYSMLKNTSEATFLADVAPFMDIGYFLHYLAVDRAIHNWDGITGLYSSNGWWGNHNFFMYEDSRKNGRFWLIPWDLDNIFSREDPFMETAGVPDWNITPASCDTIPVWEDGETFVTPPNCDLLFSLTAATSWNHYVAIGEKMRVSEFDVKRINLQIDTLKDLIRGLVGNDPTIDSTEWAGSVWVLRKGVEADNIKFKYYLKGEFP